MSEAHASAHYGGGVQAAHTISPPDDSENLGFGPDLRCGTASSPDGDNDTDDIGTYPSIMQFKSGYASDQY
jgi:hypothetical protein